MSISVILPAYREAENLAELLPKIKKAVSGIGQPYEILVIDTMTQTDNTDEICRINGCTYISREHGNNYGDAIRTGFNKAVCKYTVVMDADGSHNPDDIIRFHAEIEKGYDLIIGSRYISGGNSHNGIVLKLMSYVLNMTYRIFFRIRAKDISNSFRMYRTEHLKSLSLECDNFDIVEEIIIKLSTNIPAFKLLEIPVFFDQRKYGESKRDLVKFIFSYIITIKKLMRIKNEKHSSNRSK
jgi:dolichol-phosphate mannosyltransferase